MSSGGVLLSLILIGVVLALVLAPLFRRGQADAVALVDRQRERLQVYYERALRNIRDLDEDHALGKLDEAEYHVERAYWAERGVLALKALDRLATLNAGSQAAADDVAIAPTPADDAAIDQAIEAAIEAAVRRARERSTAPL
ncbi:MAG: hypothetical protein NZM00_04665 [Anaerolinea sp.]|nr:hypothetical protein [Anaerolinea sp.]